MSSNEFFKTIFKLLLVAAIIIFLYFVSWIIVTSVIWLLFRIFHIPFNIVLATAFWMALVIWKWIPQKKKGDSNANV